MKIINLYEDEFYKRKGGNIIIVDIRKILYIKIKRRILKMQKWFYELSQWMFIKHINSCSKKGDVAKCKSNLF